MPNWCDNTLEVSGDERTVYQFVEQAASLCDPDLPLQPIHFAALVPPPPSISDNDLVNWRLDHWGVKWEPEFFDMERSPEKVVYYFETPWGPPLDWCVAVSKKYPDLQFRVVYAEPGMDFSGDFIVRGGGVIKNLEGAYFRD